jgi:hypothetical protein
VFALRNDGMKYLKVEIDRFAAGRLGLNVRDVQQALRVWVDGRDLGIVLERERRIPLMLRGEGALRRSAADLERVVLALPGGRTVALSQVARISEEEGPIQVIREQTQRYAPCCPTCAAATWWASWPRRGRRWSSGCNSRPATAWSGAASSRTSSAPRPASPSWCRSRSPDLPAALLHLRLGPAGGAGVLQRALRGHRRRGGLWLSGEFLSVPRPSASSR